MRAIVCLLLVMGGLLAAPAAETLTPDQLHPGMKGYGLSVFKGTTPERFEVEVLGVLPNAFPKQDMILIRLSGANLERHKTIAGMSGSPIYIDGKLIGALAYGWSFENEPLAGVTPIHNMLAELNRPALPPPPSAAPASTSLPSPGALRSRAAESLQPLLTPLSLGGFSPRTVALVAEQFERLGLLPIAAGGAAGGAMHLPRGRIVPGSSIGVELIRGDLTATAVGTATYVENDRILAFGHPFFQGGQFVAPAVEAEVHTIMSSVERSFKLATAVADVGALVGDWQSCIVADARASARMIPLTVEVSDRDTGRHEQYAVEVVDNEKFSPLLAQMAIAQAIGVASGSSQDTTIRVTLSAEVAPGADAPAGRTLAITNTFFNPQGGLLNPGVLLPLAEMFNTPFGHTAIRRIDVHLEAVRARQTAIIKGAYFAKSQADRGESLPLTVVLKPFGQPETTVTVPIKVPAATETTRFLTVAVSAGEDAPADVAPPESMADYLTALVKRHRSTDLVVLVQVPGQGLQYRGQLLKNLPASVMTVLDDASTADITGIADIQQIVSPTAWILSGQAAARVPIRTE